MKLEEQNKVLQGVEKSVLENFTAKTLLENLPNPVATTTVDSEGEFVMEIPKGRYALVASTDKNDLGIEEKLLWIFWIDVSGEGITKIRLNEDNVLYSDFSDNVFKVGDFIEKTSARQ